MSALNEIVVVNINRESVGLTQAGFGTPLILGEHTRTSEKIKSYANINEVAEDFQTSDLEYNKALAMFSQEISPEKIKIGKRSANVSQVVNVTVPTVSDSTSYKITINGNEFEFVSGVGTSAELIIDGLILAIDAGNESVTTTDNTSSMDITADTAGEGFSISTSANLAYTTTTENKSVVTELQAIQDLDDDFYFVVLTSVSKFDILQLSQYIETQQKIFFALTNDANVATSIAHVQTLTMDADFVSLNTINLNINETAISEVTFDTDQSTTMGLLATEIQANADISTATVTGAREITITGQNLGVLVSITDFIVANGASQATATLATTQDPTNDIGTTLTNLNYNRTALFYSSTSNNNIESALLGLCAGLEPGSVNWGFKTLSGVTADVLSSSVKTILHNKRVNTYTSLGGVDITQYGFVSKSPNFIDIIRGDDFTSARLQEKIYGLLIANNKISFTEAGLDIIRAGINEVMAVAINQGIYSAEPALVVNMPTIASISTADKEARQLKGITIDVTRAGAINKVTLTVNISA